MIQYFLDFFDIQKGKTMLITSSKELNVHAGPNALLDYLDPGKRPPSPLVEVGAALGLFPPEDRVDIFAKAAFLDPFLNTKGNSSRRILDDAKAAGELEGVHTLGENSSGNAGLAFVTLARLFGIQKTVLAVPLDIADSKRELLELFGAECVKTMGGIDKMYQMCQQEGWFGPRQYHNLSNTEGNADWLGQQIYEQTKGLVSVVCASMGTTGTINGISQGLLRNQCRASIIGATPLTDQVPGARTRKRIEDEVGLYNLDVLDEQIEISAKESYKMSLRLCRKGVLGGPSSGLALAALVNALEGIRAEGKLDDLRNDEGRVVAVFVCPDSCLPYLDKYTTWLDPADIAGA